MKKLIIITVILLMFTSCSENRTSSKLELRQLIQQTEVSKYSSGIYFFAIGTYNQLEESKIIIKCFALVEGRYRMVEIPIEKLRIVIDDTLISPILQIEYTAMDIYSDNDLLNCSNLDKVYVLYCPEKYLPERLLPITL